MKYFEWLSLLLLGVSITGLSDIHWIWVILPLLWCWVIWPAAVGVAMGFGARYIDKINGNDECVNAVYKVILMALFGVKSTETQRTINPQTEVKSKETILEESKTEETK